MNPASHHQQCPLSSYTPHLLPIPASSPDHLTLPPSTNQLFSQRGTYIRHESDRVEHGRLIPVSLLDRGSGLSDVGGGGLAVAVQLEQLAHVEPGPAQHLHLARHGRMSELGGQVETNMALTDGQGHEPLEENMDWLITH